MAYFVAVHHTQTVKIIGSGVEFQYQSFKSQGYVWQTWESICQTTL